MIFCNRVFAGQSSGRITRCRRVTSPRKPEAAPLSFGGPNRVDLRLRRLPKIPFLGAKLVNLPEAPARTGATHQDTGAIYTWSHFLKQTKTQSYRPQARFVVSVCKYTVLATLLFPLLTFAQQRWRNTSGSVSIDSPANGATVSSPVALSATTSGATPSSILVYDNGSLILRKYGVSTITAPLTLTPGSHAITVQATENRSGRVSATANVIVADQGASAGSGTPDPPASSGGGSSSSTTVAAQISGDMTGANEGHPHGVPLSYDWANGPAMSEGNNSEGQQAMTAWGVVYEGAQGNPATNTRVNIRNVQSWFLSKSKGTWTMIQNTSTPDGDAYVEDFSGDSNKPADIRREADGTISVTAGGGYNFHFYPSPRASLDPNDIGGIVTIFEARLIVGNPSGPDDRSTAVYLAGAGGDYYPSLTGSWPGNTDYNPGIAVGKEKYVKTYWRSFAMSTVPAAQLTQNPPPIDLTGIEP